MYAGCSSLAEPPGIVIRSRPTTRDEEIVPENDARHASPQLDHACAARSLPDPGPPERALHRGAAGRHPYGHRHGSRGDGIRPCTAFPARSGRHAPQIARSVDILLIELNLLSRPGFALGGSIPDLADLSAGTYSWSPLGDYP